MYNRFQVNHEYKRGESMQRFILFGSLLALLTVSPLTARQNPLDELNELFQSNIYSAWGIESSGPYDGYYESTNQEQGASKVAPAPRKNIHKANDELLLEDYIGNEETKQRLKQVIEMFRSPERIEAFGGNMKNGLLLAGPSGTGKTRIAHIIANELDFALVKKSGSEFVNKYVGQGAANVRDVFAEAQRKAPCVLFVDEIDAIAGAVPRDGDDQSGGSAEYHQTLNEFLVQMNQLRGNKNILVICATNTIASLDAAFKAPHRFEIVTIDNPTKQVREQMIRYYASQLPRININDATIDLLAERTKKASGAMIESIFKTAILIAANDLTATEITSAHLLTALEQERESMKVGAYGLEKTGSEDNVTFADIVGISPIVDQFKNLVTLIENRDKMKAFGAVLPKGILLAGKPGCGKTMLARALANEAKCAFFHVSAASLESKYVGETAKKITDLFAKAAMVAPSIIFIDEFDALTSDPNSPGLKELLVQMDGFDKNNDVCVVAATNVPEKIDARVKRNGRFSHMITVPLPDEQARKEILAHYVDKLPRVNKESIPYDLLALHTKDFNAAALQELVNEAATRACIANADAIEGIYFEKALEKALSEKKMRR